MVIWVDWETFSGFGLLENAKPSSAQFYTLPYIGMAYLCPMKDLNNSEDLHALLSAFYSKAIPDPVIGHFFTTVVQLDLDTHLPKLVGFWEQILFGKGDYQGNPMVIHLHLNSLSKMEPAHFERWLLLFRSTVDELFTGPMAANAKVRASGIASIMQARVAMA